MLQYSPYCNTSLIIPWGRAQTILFCYYRFRHYPTYRTKGGGTGRGQCPLPRPPLNAMAGDTTSIEDT
jgi:hypothetical protein